MQAIVSHEYGDLTLEESGSLYEEGMKLARACQEMLQQAELRVTKLQESFTEGLSAFREENFAGLLAMKPSTSAFRLPAKSSARSSPSFPPSASRRRLPA